MMVTEANKKEYVKKVCEARVIKEIEKLIRAFLKSTSDLEIIVAGKQEIDLENMKKYVKYIGKSSSSQIVKCMWEILEEFKQEELAAFLGFVFG